jgi:hypothetical protein
MTNFKNSQEFFKSIVAIKSQDCETHGIRSKISLVTTNSNGVDSTFTSLRNLAAYSSWTSISLISSSYSMSKSISSISQCQNRLSLYEKS